MGNLLALLQRFHVLLLFLVLQVFSLIVLFSENNFHRKEFIRHSSDFAGYIYEKRDEFTSYLRLAEINDQLPISLLSDGSFLPVCLPMLPRFLLAFPRGSDLKILL